MLEALEFFCDIMVPQRPIGLISMKILTLCFFWDILRLSSYLQFMHSPFFKQYMMIAQKGVHMSGSCQIEKKLHICLRNKSFEDNNYYFFY